MASNIGIKIANGDFYPILEENSSVKKRLILTTVHDNQPSVQIDLYRSAVSSMTDAQYIGSLVIERIKAKPKGEPSIEMVISSNKNGDITAEAIDLDTSAGGQHCVLTVSLRSLDETARDMEYPDFELETNEEPPTGLYNKAQKMVEHRDEPVKRNTLPYIIIGLLIILGLAAIWLFLLGGLDVIGGDKGSSTAAESSWQDEPARQEPAQTTPPPAPQPQQQVTPEPQPQPTPQPAPQAATPPPSPPPVIAAPPSPPPPRPQAQQRRDRPAAPVASYNVPTTIPREGVDYRIRWGDTLWDISEAFYRDPWQYPRIAQHNNIRNPDLIISGRIIRVPPRN